MILYWKGDDDVCAQSVQRVGVADSAHAVRTEPGGLRHPFRAGQGRKSAGRYTRRRWGRACGATRIRRLFDALPSLALA